jgi:KDO2-lipid IV(A) lauroyltransferase
MNRTQLEKRDNRFRENIFKKLANSILVGLLIFISWLPFWVLYGISDFFYLLLRHVLKYRHKVITENLVNAFPQKTEKEISKIRNQFYRHICDIFFESIKIYSIPEKELEKRLNVTGYERANQYHTEKRSIIAMAFHYNNWEWTSYVQSKLSHQILSVYNPIRGNHALENFLVHNRERWGSKCVPVQNTARTAMAYQLKGITTGLWLAADQTPSSKSKFWTLFLNQETPFFSGPEKIAIKGNLPMFFQHTKKVGRGKYVIEYSLLFDNPKDIEPKDILLAYIRKCEEIIRAEPQYYLWSHRRWKHTRPEGIELS